MFALLEVVRLQRIGQLDQPAVGKRLQKRNLRQKVRIQRPLLDEGAVQKARVRLAVQYPRMHVVLCSDRCRAGLRIQKLFLPKRLATRNRPRGAKLAARNVANAPGNDVKLVVFGRLVAWKKKSVLIVDGLSTRCSRGCTVPSCNWFGTASIVL